MRLERLIRHWLACHETFAADRPRLARVHMVRYEDLVVDADGTVSAVDSFLGLEPHAVTHACGHARNQPHRERWRHEPDRVALTERFEEAVNRFGYSLAEWDA